MNNHKLLRKKARIKKQEKKKFSKGSGTLAGQVSRTKTLKNYSGAKKKKVKVKI